MVPSQDYSQGSPEPRAISEFNDFLEKNKLQSQIEPKQFFVCITVVKKYLGEQDWERDCQRLEALLDALYPDHDNNKHFTEQVLNDYTAILCILVKIRKGRHIKSFVEGPYSDDKHLPFTPKTKPDSFPEDSNDAEFYEKFCEAQWTFLPLSFKKNMGKNLGNSSRLILPITLMEEGASGGSGSVSRIEIHGCYHDRPHESPCTSHKSLDTFALKTYHESGSQSSKWEVEAYQKLSECPQITKYYGNFTHNNTKYVLMEYANKGSLEKYLKDTVPPARPDDISAFWKGLLDITKALSYVHSHSILVGGHRKKEVGWHYDVKPDNILVFGNKEKDSLYNCLFKLTDFGLSMFKKTDGKSTEHLSTEGGGTTTYGAPETFKPDPDWENTPILTSRKVDLWSFACILSEAIVWMGLNYNGLEDYRKARFAHESRKQDPGLSDCFHDGQKVLDLVREWHMMAMQSLRICDHITAIVVEIIEEQIFYEDPKLMKNAKELSYMFTKELKEAGKPRERTSTGRRPLGTPATPSVVPTPHMALPGRLQVDETDKLDEAKADEVEEVDKISGLQALLDEADKNFKRGHVGPAGENYEEARKFWNDNFSSLPKQLLQLQLRIYLGERKALIEQGKSLREDKKEKKKYSANADHFERLAKRIQHILNLMN